MKEEREGANGAVAKNTRQRRKRKRSRLACAGRERDRDRLKARKNRRNEKKEGGRRMETVPQGARQRRTWLDRS